MTRLIAPSSGVLRWGGERARAAHWRGDREVALLSPVPNAPPPSVEFLRRCMDTLAARGFRRVVTGALSPSEQAGFLAAGFDVEQRLHLLAIDLTADLPRVPPGVPLRRVKRRRRMEVLEVDRAAFPVFWQFDAAGLRDALRATPSVRFRAAVDPPGGSFEAARGLIGQRPIGLPRAALLMNDNRSAPYAASGCGKSASGRCR